MKRTLLMHSNLAIAGLLFSGFVMAASQQSAPATGTKPETEKSAAKETKAETSADQKKESKSNGVTPHNHMRDAKGVYISPKKPKASEEVKTEKKDKTESGTEK